MLDAPEQALHERGPLHRSGLVHHSDRGSQYFSVLDTECLAQAVIEASVGSAGDGYDNALATSINGFCKAEVKHQGGPGIRHPRVVDRFNHRRLVKPIGNILPAEAKALLYDAAQENLLLAA